MRSFYLSVWIIEFFCADIVCIADGSNLQADGTSWYHQGFSSDVATPTGPIHLALAFNPSHLEIVNPAVDDNVNKKNKYLHGVPIVGTRDDIKKNVKKYNINEIIISMPSASANDVRKVIAICQETGLPTKILPSVTRSLSSSIVSELRPVSYVDLQIGRAHV